MKINGVELCNSCTRKMRLKMIQTVKEMVAYIKKVNWKEEDFKQNKSTK